jgi:tetratricopeptide (TPR) repeat protein
MMGTADRGEPQSVTDAAVLANALLGDGLPPEAEFHLWEAGLSYHLDDVAEHHLREAQALAPGHAAVLIGLYRFYFYKGRLADALTVAKLCLEKAARENRLAADWRNVAAGDAAFGHYENMLAPDWQNVAAGDAAFGHYENMLPRFYLFTLKGYAYLQMRLGNLEEGRAAVAKLLELDPSDKVGARVLLGVLERVGQDDG